MGGCIYLSYLNIGSNRLSGNLDRLSDLVNLNTLIASNNNFKGGLSFLKSFPKDSSPIEHISLENNQLSGVIPSRIGYFSNLKIMYVIFIFIF